MSKFTDFVETRELDDPSSFVKPPVRSMSDPAVTGKPSPPNLGNPAPEIGRYIARLTSSLSLMDPEELKPHAKSIARLKGVLDRISQPKKPWQGAEPSYLDRSSLSYEVDRQRQFEKDQEAYPGGWSAERLRGTPEEGFHDK